MILTPSAWGITHKTTRRMRYNIIQNFRNKGCQVLFTRDIFNEGVDFPFVEALLFLRPTYSKTIFLQQLGRGLRLSKGKENVMILDFIGNYRNAYLLRKWLGFAEQSKDPLKETIERRPEYDYELFMSYRIQILPITVTLMFF